MPGKLIAQENSINEKIKALQGDQKTPEALRAIIETAILECTEEQARTKSLQLKTEVSKVNILAKEGLEESDKKNEDAEALIMEIEARKNAKENTAKIEKFLEKAGGIEKIIGSEYNTLLKETIAERDTENKKNGKDLSDEELRTEARTQIFLNNRDKIEKACPDAKDALTALF